MDMHSSAYRGRRRQQRWLSRRRLLQATGLGGAGVAAAALLGCRREEKPIAETTAVEQPRMGGIIHTYHHVDPPSFDLYINYGLHSIVTNSFTYSKLVRMRAGPDVGPLETVMVPDLAEKLEQPDSLTYIFTLGENVVWQNSPPLHGRSLTAQDIAFNWELYSARHTNRERIVPHVDTFSVLDQRRVQFRMKRPLAPFLYYIGHPSDLYIYPPELKRDDATRQTMVGTGAWQLERYDVGSAITFIKNRTYYKAPLPYADGLVIHIIRDASTVIANLRTGTIDVTMGSPTSVPAADVPSLEQALRGAKWLKAPFPATSTITMDISDPKFRDERVRQAISLAIDREGWLQLLGGGTAYGSPLPPITPWWLDPKQDPQMRPYYTRDLARARQLLSAAGFPSGLSGVKYNFDGQSPEQRDVGQLIAANLREAGINLELNAQSTAEAFATTFVGKHLGAMGDSAGTFTRDPDEGFTLVFTDNPRSPIPGKELLSEDRRLLDLIERQRGEVDAQQRKAIVDDLQRYLSQKMYALGKVAPLQAHVAQPKVRNMHWLRTLDPGILFDEVWLAG